VYRIFRDKSNHKLLQNITVTFGNILLLAGYRDLGYSGIMFNERDKMKKELLSQIKKARYCFAWCNIYVDDGAYLQVTKDTLRYIVKKAHEDSYESLTKTFVLRDDGDLYIN